MHSVHFEQRTLQEWQTVAEQQPREGNGHVWTGIARMLKRKPQPHYTCLLVQSKIVGAYVLTQRAGAGKLQLIDVFAKNRGLGYGRCLLEHAIASAKSANLKRLCIDGARGARGFYLACGLSPMPRKSYDAYVIDLEDNNSTELTH